MTKRTDEKLVEQAVQMYRDGGTAPTIARSMGMSDTVLYRELKARGIVPSDLMRRGDRGAANRKLPLNAGRQIVAEYRDGASLNALAAKYGVSAVAIRHALKQQGEPRRRRGGIIKDFSDDQREEMARMWKAGESQTLIGARFGVTQTVISRVLSGMGAEVRPRHARGERHGSWRGGRSNAGNYIAVLVMADSPFASMRRSQGYVMEHRLVMAEALGRPLTAHETVHHINGDTRDNRLENLQLRNGKHGAGTVWRCRDCGSQYVEAIELKGH